MYIKQWVFTTVPKGVVDQGRCIVSNGWQEYDKNYLLLVLLPREEIVAELRGEDLTDTGGQGGTCHI